MGEIIFVCQFISAPAWTNVILASFLLSSMRYESSATGSFVFVSGRWAKIWFVIFIRKNKAVCAVDDWIVMVNSAGKKCLFTIMFRKSPLVIDYWSCYVWLLSHNKEVLNFYSHSLLEATRQGRFRNGSSNVFVEQQINEFARQRRIKTNNNIYCLVEQKLKPTDSNAEKSSRWLAETALLRCCQVNKLELI